MRRLEFPPVYADGDVQVRNHKQGTSRSQQAPDMPALGQSSRPLLRKSGLPTVQKSKMSNAKPVYILVLSGELEDAKKFVSTSYPGHPITVLSKRILRQSGWRTKIRQLRTLRGEALVIFSSSLLEQRELRLFLCSGFVHRCHETVLCDALGRSTVCTCWRLLMLVPAT